MRLAAVFIAWGDCDLLPYAVENIRPVVDGVIIVWSRKSNHGKEMEYELPGDCTLVQWEPLHRPPQHNELAKRNVGMEKAKELGYTHFIMMDGDEFYRQDEFTEAKALIEENGILGSVCRLKTYFKSPTLTIGHDHTLVPFIHRLRPSLQYKLNFHGYPFAYQKGTAYIDPTRRLNVTGGIRMMEGVTMHHYSWIRKDMALKMENSSANLRGSRGQIMLDDLKEARSGYFCKGYQRTLIECENLFNLPIYD